MSSYDFNDYNNDGDSEEDKEELIWNEFDWQYHLNENKQEVESFKKLYAYYLKHDEEPLRSAIKHMGWVPEEPTEDSEGEFLFFDVAESDEDSEEETEDLYTFYKHPLLIASLALYDFIKEQWEQLLISNPTEISAVLTWQFALVLRKGELQSVFAVYALETADYSLSVAHLKHALSAINEVLNVLNQIKNFQSPFIKAISTTLFDLRETWLRCMNTCRDVINGNFNDLF